MDTYELIWTRCTWLNDRITGVVQILIGRSDRGCRLFLLHLVVSFVINLSHLLLLRWSGHSWRSIACIAKDGVLGAPTWSAKHHLRLWTLLWLTLFAGLLLCIGVWITLRCLLLSSSSHCLFDSILFSSFFQMPVSVFIEI